MYTVCFSQAVFSFVLEMLLNQGFEAPSIKILFLLIAPPKKFLKKVSKNSVLLKSEDFFLLCF